MTNLCFIFFFKISLEHILLSQDCLKCCQRPNNQWHMQLKSWLIFNNHTSRQLNYSYKEQKNQLLRTPRLGCKKSTTFYASSFKDEEETKSSDKWCQIPENQWHMQLKWWLTFNSQTNQQLNYSHKEQKNQLPPMPRLLCKKSTTLMHNQLRGWIINRTIKYSTINDIPMQLKSWLIFNSLTSQQPNYDHKERRSQQPQTYRLGRERCTTLTWNSFKDEEEKPKVSDKSGTESDGIDLTDRSFNITPTSTTQFHNNMIYITIRS